MNTELTEKNDNTSMRGTTRNRSSLLDSLLLIGAFYEVMDAFSIVTDGALRGAGDTRAPFVARLLLAWGVQVPLAWLFGIYWQGGVAGAWLGSGVYMLTLSLYLWIRFRSDAWQRIKI